MKNLRCVVYIFKRIFVGVKFFLHFEIFAGAWINTHFCRFGNVGDKAANDRYMGFLLPSDIRLAIIPTCALCYNQIL